MKTIVAALFGAVLAATSASAAVTVGIEAAGVQQTTQSVAGKQVVTFTDMPGWVGSGNVFSGGSVSGTIQSGGFRVYDANVYGGAGGSGQFATVYDTTTIQLSRAVTYAGVWASAIDGDFASTLGNTIALYSGDTLLGSYALKPLLADAGAGYWGNPTSNYAGQNVWEPYAFFNFNSSVAFDRIDIVQNGGGGFELDNLTIGNPALISEPTGPGLGDNVEAAVPEPKSWAMMFLGFGAMGLMLRAGKRQKVARA